VSRPTRKLRCRKLESSFESKSTILFESYHPHLIHQNLKTSLANSGVLDRRKRRRDALDQDDEDEPIAGNPSLTHTAQPQAKSSGSDALDDDDEEEPSPKHTRNGFTLPTNTKTPYNNKGLHPHCVFNWLAAGTFQSVLCEKVYTLLASYYPGLRPWFS